MTYNLITPTNEDWSKKTDIISYSVRQAQSCKYLDKAFTEILSKTEDTDGELKILLDYLNNIHKIQYQDLIAVVDVPEDKNRKSFYFEYLYKNWGLNASALPDKINNDQILMILVIQAVSYLRGHDRYKILKDYMDQPKDIRLVYLKFWSDAITNAEKVLQYLDNHFDKKLVQEKIKEVIKEEDKMIHKIWKYNEVKS